MPLEVLTIVDNACYHIVNDNGPPSGVRFVFMPHYCLVSNDNATLRQCDPSGGEGLPSVGPPMKWPRPKKREGPRFC